MERVGGEAGEVVVEVVQVPKVAKGAEGWYWSVIIHFERFLM